MDLISPQALETLLDGDPGWHVSLFMPAHRSGRETEQDPIRYRNLLREAEERLLGKDMRTPDVREMLAPAQRLLQDPDFWRHQSDGLAVYISPSAFHSYRLPLPFEALVVVSHRYHIKPLLPFFTGDGHFYILALSQNQVRLLEGTRHTVDEIELGNLLKSLAEVFDFERFEKHLQFHTGTGSAPGDRPAMYHGHSLSNQAKNQILQWFHRIDDELPSLLTGTESPVVLAGVEYLFSLYREANSYPHLVDQGIPGNPEELSPAQLHAQAWPLVQPIFAQAQAAAAERYLQLNPTGQTTAEVKGVLLAAHHGRVAVLFAALNQQLWGRYDPNMDTLELHDDPEPGDEDLLDLAAIQTVLNGGTVYVVAPDQMPAQAPLAAVFRY